MIRYQTYELTPGNFGTYDSNSEPMPTEFIAGPFDVNMQEADLIAEGASIQLDGDQVTVVAE